MKVFLDKLLVFCEGIVNLENEINSLPYVPKVLILHHLLFFSDTLHAENSSVLVFSAQTQKIYLSQQMWLMNENKLESTYFTCLQELSLKWSASLNKKEYSFSFGQRESLLFVQTKDFIKLGVTAPSGDSYLISYE